jgi:hypothetical protein
MYSRWPIEAVNPTHQQGQLKTNPRKVSQANPLIGSYHHIKIVFGKSDRSESYMGKMQEQG